MTLFPESARGLFRFFPRTPAEIADPPIHATGCARPDELADGLPLDELLDRPPTTPQRVPAGLDARVVHVRLDRSSVEALDRFPGLQRVTWAEQKSAAIPKPILGLPGLRVLDFDHTRKVRKLPSRWRHEGLEALRLTNVHGLNDISVVTRLPALTRLDLFNAVKLADFAPLAEAPRLAHLALCACSLAVPGEQLSGLPSLGSLDLGGSGHLPSSVAGADRLIAAHPGLTALGLRGADLALFQPFVLPEVRELDLTFAATIPDWVLAGVPGVRALKLQSHRSAELPAGLGELAALRYLDLSGASALLPAALAPLAGLMELAQLNLANAPLIDALPSAIGTLTGLRRLDLGPAVTDIRVLRGLPSLVELTAPGVTDAAMVHDVVQSLPALERLQVHPSVPADPLLTHPRLWQLHGPDEGREAEGWVRRERMWLRSEA